MNRSRERLNRNTKRVSRKRSSNKSSIKKNSSSNKRAGSRHRSSRAGSRHRSSRAGSRRKAGSWAVALKKAYAELGLKKFTPMTKGGVLYNKTKEIHERRGKRSRTSSSRTSF
jgi:hypothetical protein